MLNAAVGSGRPIHFLHCARNRAVHAFREHVDGLAARHANLRRTYLYSQPAAADQADAVGLISESVLAGALPADRDAEVYFIGPKPFMAEVKRLLAKLGVPEPQTHYEFFGPLQTLE
jgi:nitric oxide dioxygenase